MDLKYECGICGEVYDKESSALNCERRGIESPLIKEEDEVIEIIRYTDIPWKYRPVIVSKIESHGHNLIYSFKEKYTGVPCVTSVFSNEGLKRNYKF